MKCLLLLAVVMSFAGGLSAADRVALVIGNNRYTNLPDSRQLASPVADATDVAAALKALGYKIVTGGPVTDAGKDTIITATETFATEAKGAEAAVFYFSGHGVQVGEDNYLLPSDAPKLTGISVLKNRSVLLRDAVMVALEESRAKTKVIILDCCRDNPFSAQLEVALAQVGKSVKTKSVGEISGYGPGFYLAFATSPGFTADDGNGKRNSPFTSAMLRALPVSAGKDIDFFFRDVKALLGDSQVSWTNHSLNDTFALARNADGSAPAPSQLVAMLPPAPVEQEPPPAAPFAAGTVLNLEQLFDGTPYDLHNSHSRTRILKLAQEKLKNAGLYASTLDGSPGPGTQKAIIDWQEQNGLDVTGRLDRDTQRSLGLDGLAETAAPTVTTSPRRAPATAPAQPRPATPPAKTGGDISVEEFLQKAKALRSQ